MSSKGADILVVGIGNPLRSDDGVGPYVVGRIAKRNIKGVQTMLSQQLNIELLEEMASYKRVLVVDAACGREGMDFRKVTIADGRSPASSHHLSPELFLLLAKMIYNLDLDLYLCTIGASHFEIGQTMSPEVIATAQKAVEEISAFLKGA